MNISGVITNFTSYDGDGNRVKQVVAGGNTTLYINKYYEENSTSLNATSYYYLGGTLVAMKQGGANVSYIHQDSLGGTSVVSNSSGTLVSSISYSPFGVCRNSQGNLGTDRLFTGQRLDSTGLYYYGARYYDPTIGRFISPDIISQNPANPQTLNRYSYVTNNPLRFTDPTGHWVFGLDDVMATEELGMPVAQEVWEAAIAFEAVREAEPMMASLMEGSETYFALESNDPGLLTITSDKSGRSVDFVVAGEDSGMSAMNQYVLSAQKADFVKPASNVPVLIADYVAEGGDVASIASIWFPPVSGGAWIVSAVGSYVGFQITGDRYFDGQVSERDYKIAAANYYWGFVPYVGIIPAENQRRYDLKQPSIQKRLFP